MTDIKRITRAAARLQRCWQAARELPWPPIYPVTDTAEVEATSATSSVDDANRHSTSKQPEARRRYLYLGSEHHHLQ